MKRILFVSLLLLITVGLRAQQVALKTNALFDVAMVPNLGIEVRAGRSLTVNASACVGYGIYGHDMNLQGVSAGLRYWTMDFPMYGLFVGFDVSGTHYDMTFSREGFMGDAIAGGVNIGWAFAWRNHPHWHFEVETTVGGIYYSHKHRWVQDYIKTREYNQRGMLFMPYRVGFNVVYIIPHRNEVDSKRAHERRHAERRWRRQQRRLEREAQQRANSQAPAEVVDPLGEDPF